MGEGTVSSELSSRPVSRAICGPIVLLLMLAFPSVSASECLASVRAIPFEPPARFEATHGELLEGAVAPYVDEVSRQFGLSGEDLTRLLSPQPIGLDGLPFLYVSSWSHIQGNWTYFTSSSLSVFEAIPIQLEEGKEPTLAVLHTDPYWRLSLLEKDGLIVQSIDLEEEAQVTPSRGQLGGDMVYTDLGVERGALRVSVAFAITGTGGFPLVGTVYTFGASEEELCLAGTESADSVWRR